MKALQMECSGLPHAFPRKIQSAAFNGSSYILLDTQNQAAFQYGQDFEWEGWTSLEKKYTAVCYDTAEACYWAVENYNAETIYRLDSEWKVTGKYRVENVSKRFASGIGIDMTNNIWLSFLDNIAYVEKGNAGTAPVFEEPCCKGAHCKAVLPLPVCTLCVCSVNCREYICICRPYCCKSECLCIPKDCGFVGMCRMPDAANEENGWRYSRFAVFLTNYFTGELHVCQCRVKYRLNPMGEPCDFELQSDGCLESVCMPGGIVCPPAKPCCGTPECCEPCCPPPCCEPPVCCEPCGCCEPPMCCEPCGCCEPCQCSPCECGCKPPCCDPCGCCGHCDPCSCDPCKDCGCNGHCGCAKCQVIESIALQEAGLSHILNAEGEKIQKAVAQSTSTEELLAVNESVRRIIVHVTQLEMQLYIKLEAMLCEDNKKHPCRESGICSECQASALE